MFSRNILNYESVHVLTAQLLRVAILISSLQPLINEATFDWAGAAMVQSYLSFDDDAMST